MLLVEATLALRVTTFWSWELIFLLSQEPTMIELVADRLCALQFVLTGQFEQHLLGDLAGPLLMCCGWLFLLQNQVSNGNSLVRYPLKFRHQIKLPPQIIKISVFTVLYQPESRLSLHQPIFFTKTTSVLNTPRNGCWFCFHGKTKKLE